MPHSQCVYCLKYVNTHRHAKKKKKRRVRAALLFELSQTHTFSSQELTQWLFCCVKCGAPQVDVNAFGDTRCALMPFFFVSFKLIVWVSYISQPLSIRYQTTTKIVKCAIFTAYYITCTPKANDFSRHFVGVSIHIRGFFSANFQRNIPKLWHVNRMESSRVNANIRILRKFLCIGAEFGAMLEIGLTCGKITLFFFLFAILNAHFSVNCAFSPGFYPKEKSFQKCWMFIIFSRGRLLWQRLKIPLYWHLIRFLRNLGFIRINGKICHLNAISLKRAADNES